MKNRAELDHLKDLSDLLDTRFTGPFGIRFGLDGLLGFIPVLGDFVTAGLSLYIIIHAAALGCTPSILIRMGGNVLIENIFDTIPFIGNFFDIFWKSNLKNMRLLEDYLDNPRAVTWKSRLVLVMVCLVLIGAVVGTAALTVKILSAIF